MDIRMGVSGRMAGWWMGERVARLMEGIALLELLRLSVDCRIEQDQALVCLVVSGPSVLSCHDGISEFLLVGHYSTGA